jgi:hypothetical protein
MLIKGEKAGIEGADALFYAFLSMWCSLIFTNQTFCSMIHSLLTKRRIGISFKFVIDVVLFVMVVWCASLYWNWSQIPQQTMK